MGKPVTLDGLILVGKVTLELTFGPEGAGVFHPILLSEYMDNEIEISLIAGDPRDDDLMSVALKTSMEWPLRSISLTTIAWMATPGRETVEAMSVLYVDAEGPQTAIVPYDRERSAHQSVIVWGDAHVGESDPAMVAALYRTVIMSHATME